MCVCKNLSVGKFSVSHFSLLRAFLVVEERGSLFYLDCACSPLQQHRARGPTAGWRWPRANKSLYFDSLLERSAENTIRLMEVRKYLVVIQKSLLLCVWRCNDDSYC